MDDGQTGNRTFAVHFASLPYTSGLKLANSCFQNTEYSGEIKLAVVPFTEIKRN